MVTKRENRLNCERHQPQQSMTVLEWLCTDRIKNIPLNVHLLQEKTRELTENLKTSNFEASNG